MITNADQDTLANFLSSMQSYNMDELKSLGLNFDQGLAATADPNILLMKRSSLSEEPELTPMQPSTPQDQRVPTNPPGGVMNNPELTSTHVATATKRSASQVHSPSPSSNSTSPTTSTTSNSAPPNGKKTKGRVKIKMEFINNKLRRYTTFSKRKTGIMKKVCFEMRRRKSSSNLTQTRTILFFLSFRIESLDDGRSWS